MLRVKKLTKKFGKKYANEDVNLSLDEGEIGVLLGPNGAGKSTTMKCILGLLSFEGEVTVGGNPVRSVEAKKMLGYVPETPALYPMLTVREHFEFIIRAYHLNAEKTKEYAIELAERFRLTEVMDYYCKDLSKGMQQKVSIICALLPHPKILLLDEPMMGLDPHAIKELRVMISELSEEGVAILISTHLISTVEGIWNKAYIMRKGQILSCHKKEEMVGVWAESLERIFFAETESYDSIWQTPSPAKAPTKQSHTVTRPNTAKKKKNTKKKKK
ncbi:MAG: ABC transporter ATP-binding protein [Clostridiales bacterium]|nr:ABC transporter ATP-binding protein [Clostridiales bacterium]